MTLIPRGEIKDVILTLEGALLRVPIPSFARRMPWEATYRRPGGGFTTRTVAEFMREDLVRQFMRTYRELEFEEQERRKAYGQERTPPIGTTEGTPTEY